MHDDTLLLLATVYLVVISMVVSIVDIRHLIIPNALNAAILVGGLAYAVLSKTTLVLPCLAGGALGFAAFLAFRSGYRAIRGHEGLGLGDAKFMAGAGLWVGWQGLAPLLTTASLSALVFLLVKRLVTGRLDRDQRLPFGPFLCAGMVAVWGVQTAGWAPWIGLS